MLFRLVILCLMIAFAIPGGAHACGHATGKATSVMTEVGACHEDSADSAIQDKDHQAAQPTAASDLCGCALHVAWGAPWPPGDGLPLRLADPVRVVLPAPPALQGLGAAPSLPPPNPAFS